MLLLKRIETSKLFTLGKRILFTGCKLFEFVCIAVCKWHYPDIEFG